MKAAISDAALRSFINLVLEKSTLREGLSLNENEDVEDVSYELDLDSAVNSNNYVFPPQLLNTPEPIGYLKDINFDWGNYGPDVIANAGEFPGLGERPTPYYTVLGDGGLGRIQPKNYPYTYEFISSAFSSDIDFSPSQEGFLDPETDLVFIDDSNSQQVPVGIVCVSGPIPNLRRDGRPLSQASQEQWSERIGAILYFKDQDLSGFSQVMIDAIDDKLRELFKTTDGTGADIHTVYKLNENEGPTFGYDAPVESVETYSMGRKNTPTHTGWDISVPVETPVLAMMPGIIASISRPAEGTGWLDFFIMNVSKATASKYYPGLNLQTFKNSAECPRITYPTSKEISDKASEIFDLPKSLKESENPDSKNLPSYADVTKKMSSIIPVSSQPKKLDQDLLEFKKAALNALARHRIQKPRLLEWGKGSGSPTSAGVSKWIDASLTFKAPDGSFYKFTKDPGDSDIKQGVDGLPMFGAIGKDTLITTAKIETITNVNDPCYKGPSRGGLSLRIKHVDHNYKVVEVFYGHLTDVEVEVGEAVDVGRIVGTSGGGIDREAGPARTNAGRTTAPHLHIQIKTPPQNWSKSDSLYSDYILTRPNAIPAWRYPVLESDVIKGFFKD